VRGRGLVAILLIAASLRFGLLVAVAERPEAYHANDSYEYVALARDLAGAYGWRPGELTELGLRRVPGYPVFLMVVGLVLGLSTILPLVVQVGLAVVTTLLVYLLARDLLGRRGALAAALIVAIEPASVVHTCYLLSETLFSALLVAGLLVWWRGVRAGRPPAVLGGALLLGVSVLVRAIALLLPVVLIPVALAAGHGDRRARRGLVALSLLGFVLVPGAWLSYNSERTGIAVVSTIPTYNLLRFRAAGTLARAESIPLEAARERLGAEVDRLAGTDHSYADTLATERSVALRTLAAHPRAFVEVTVLGAARTLLGPGRGSLLKLLGRDVARRPSGPLDLVLIGMMTAITAAIVLAAAIGVVRLARAGRWPVLGLVSGSVLYLIALSAGPEAYARFRVPLAPFLAILAAAAVRPAVAPDRRRGALL